MRGAWLPLASARVVPWWWAYLFTGADLLGGLGHVRERDVGGPRAQLLGVGGEGSCFL